MFSIASVFLDTVTRERVSKIMHFFSFPLSPRRMRLENFPNFKTPFYSAPRAHFAEHSGISSANFLQIQQIPSGKRERAG